MLAKVFTTFTLLPHKTAEFFQALTHENLTTLALQPRNKTLKSSIGFVAPVPAALGGDGLLVHHIDGAVIFRVSQIKAVTKDTAIASDTNDAIAAFTLRTGEAPDKGEIYEIKSRITAEHLATAKNEVSHWHGWLDTQANRLMIAAPSNVAEVIGGLMRKAMLKPLGGLFISKIKTPFSCIDTLTGFIRNDGHSEGTTQGGKLGQVYQTVINGKLKFAGVDTGQEVAIKGDYSPEFITLLLDCDYKLFSAELLINGRIYLTLDKNWNISAADLNPDALIEDADDYSDDDIDEQAARLASWQANAFLTVVELRAALSTLIEQHGGLEVAKDDDTPLSEAQDAPDTLLSEAIALVKTLDKPTTSRIQRQLKIGYNRASRLLEELEGLGFVSAPDANTGARTRLTP